MLSLLPQDPAGSGYGAGGLSPEDLPTQSHSLLWEKIASYGKKLERGREGGEEERKERNIDCIPTPFGPLARHSEMNQKNLLPLKDPKSSGGNQS